jgi:hypothetical protein
MYYTNDRYLTRLAVSEPMLFTGTGKAESSELKNGRGCWYVEGYSPRLYWNCDVQEQTRMFLRLHAQRQTLRSWRCVVPTVQEFPAWRLSPLRWQRSKKKKLNSMVWVRERTIPTERQQLVGEVIANFCGRVPRSQRDGSLRPYSRFSRQGPPLFYQVAPQLYSRCSRTENLYLLVCNERISVI